MKQSFVTDLDVEYEQTDIFSKPILEELQNHGKQDSSLWNELEIDTREMLSRREWYQNAANLCRYNF